MQKAVNVKNMSYMFAGCEQFHQDISNWNVSKNSYPTVQSFPVYNILN